MKLFYIFIVVFFFLVGLIMFPVSVKASEGIIELQSTTGGNQRCYAVSILIQNYIYHILVSCRNLVYPPSADQSTYILWANLIPAQSVRADRPAKLGELGFGKNQFGMTNAFSSLFVTSEVTSSAGTPSANVVMRGDVRPITFLEGTGRITPTSEITKPAESFGELVKKTPTPTPKAGFVSGVLSALLILAGIIIFVIIVTVIIFLINRSRRSSL